MRHRCASPKTTMWSTHSRRIDPISRSAKPFCQGEAGAVGLPKRSGQTSSSWVIVPAGLWRESHGFEPLYAFRKNCFISCNLLVHRDHDTAFQARTEGRFNNSQQEDFCAAKLRELRSLP